MQSPNKFQRVYQEPDDAVTVVLIEIDGVTLGEASWPIQASDGRLIGPMLGDPKDPRVAFNHAIDIQQRLGLSRIVVKLGEGARWNPDWGLLTD